MKRLKEQYRTSFAFLRGPLYPFLKNTVLAFLIIYVIFFAASFLFPAVLDALVDYINAVVASADITNSDGSFSASGIFINNIRAALNSIIYGFIPLIYLPALPIGLNASILGSITALYVAADMPLLLLLAGILPHGIFEIPALMLAFSCGLYLCHEMNALVKNQEDRTPLPQTLRSLLRVFLCLIVPMLLAAAWIEANITPLCMALFM